MSLAEDLAQPSAPKSRGCGTADWITSLSPSDQDLVNTALADPRWTAVDLLPRLQKNGFPRGLATLKRHRQGECPCA